MSDTKNNWEKLTPDEIDVRINCFKQTMKSKIKKLAISGVFAMAITGIAISNFYSLDTNACLLVETWKFRYAIFYTGIALASASVAHYMAKNVISLSKNIQKMQLQKINCLMHGMTERKK